MLRAIREALGDEQTIFVLRETNKTSLDAGVECERFNGVFHLHGYAPFVFVFGYGWVAVDEAGESLGQSARTTLADAVGMLGWDLTRLRSDRCRPAINALYGNKLDDGVSLLNESASSQPPADLPVRFAGPFMAGIEPNSRCLFEDPLARETGVYLWTVNIEGVDRVWYVGQTRVRFGIRMAQHLTAMLSGQYTTYDAAALSKGDHRRAGKERSGVWPATLPAFLQEYEALAPQIAATIRLMHFHLAPLSGDAHVYNRVEGAIARYYKKHPEATLKNFLTPGLRVPAAIPFDTPLRVLFSSEAPIAGLPPELLV